MNRITTRGRATRWLGAFVAVLALLGTPIRSTDAAPILQPVIFGEGLLPAPNSTTPAGAIVIGCTVSSALPLVSYSLSVDNVPLATQLGASGPPWLLRAISDFRPGMHTASAFVTDSAGQEAGWTWQFTVQAAPPPPTAPPPTPRPPTTTPVPLPGQAPGVRPVTPPADWLVPAGTTHVAVRFSSDSGWQSRSISLDGQPLSLKSEGAGAGSEVLGADAPVGTGSHTLTAVGVDQPGRRTVTEWSFVASQPLGGGDLRVTPLNPPPGQTLASGASVRLVALAESKGTLQGLAMLLDGRAMAPEGGDVDPHRATLVLDATRVPPGRHVVRVQGGDETGKTIAVAWDFYVGPPAAPTERLYYPQTGYSVTGPFRAYWDTLGKNAVAVLGYPISGLTVERLDDGHDYTVQYFERVRLEWHPENRGTEFEVLYGLLGTHFHKPDPPGPQVTPRAGERYFPETGHLVRSAFLQKWQTTGGVRVHGYPISEELQEVSPTDGRAYLVQYFQRARFEYHPENAGSPFEVLLGMLGRQLYQERNPDR
ncbi:MAG TPA: hypothetical protein VM536_03700 [Chloroflexia bacterium]|nr:hypothetical protein [Chloroflexia bacterium]